MGAMFRKLLEMAIVFGGLALAGTGATAQSIAKVSKTAPIVVDAARTEGNLRTHHLILYNPVITQDELKITAERADATGLDFQNSRWIFTANVHLTSPQQGNLHSDELVVEFRNSQIQTAVATGHPAEFEQTGSRLGILARGHADEIRYAFGAGTVRLTKDAWIKYGENEMTGPSMIYSIKEQRLIGAGSNAPGGRVHITLLPKKGASGARAQSGRAASPGAPP